MGQELAASLALGCLLLYLVAGAVYRLYFSPLAKFPGPKLAALTLWYEFYFDVVLRGRFTFKIQELHKKYGPIIRINPYELHVEDPEFYEELYGGTGRKVEKFPWSANMFGNATSMISTVSHEGHRARRAPLNSFFSKQSVYNLEPTIRNAISLLCSRLDGFRESREPVVLDVAYAALTMDIITEYSFAKSAGALKKPRFDPELVELMAAASEFSLLHKQFPFIQHLILKTPDWLSKMIIPKSTAQVEFQKFIRMEILSVKEERSTMKTTASKLPTIFHELLQSNLPESEKQLQRLVDEGQTIVGAGILTTTHFLTVTSYHILANPHVLQKLRDELRPHMANQSVVPPLRQLEQLSYLNAVVKEGFRISYGVTSRLTRVYPDDPLVYKDWFIPAGTPVGMTSLIVHENDAIFPEPKVFRPERWLAADSQKLEKHLTDFNRGSRACLGMNLAKAEIFLTLAAVFGRQYDVELYETDRSDADVKHDFFNPHAKRDSKGVRIIIS